MLEFVMLERWKPFHSIVSRIVAVTYYQNLEEVPWHLGLKTLNRQKVKNLKTIYPGEK